MRVRRNLLFSSVLLIASCLLLACGPVVPNKSANNSERGDFVNPDYKAPGLEEVKPRDTVHYLLNKHETYLDLHSLVNYVVAVTKDDLLPLRTAEGKFVRGINLDGLELTDEAIEPLTDLKLTQLQLDNNQLKDLHALKGMTSLNDLRLMNNPINSEGMRVIGGLPNLTGLSLQRTPITDADLPSLYGLKNLVEVGLGGCPRLTRTAAVQLQKNLPNCEIKFAGTLLKKIKNGFDILVGVQDGLMRQEKFDKADSVLKRNISDWEKQGNPPYELIAEGYRIRAKCQQGMKRPKLQLEMLTNSLTLYKGHFSDYVVIPQLEYECADLLDAMNDPGEALAMSESADEFWKRHLPADSIRGQFQENSRKIGYKLEAKGEYQRAKEYFQTALASANRFFPIDSVEITESKKGIASCDYMSGDFKSAIKLLEEMVHTYKAKSDQDGENEANVMLAECYLKQGNNKAAETLLKNWLNSSHSDYKRAQVYKDLALALEGQKKKGEADGYREKLKNVGVSEKE